MRWFSRSGRIVACLVLLIVMNTVIGCNQKEQQRAVGIALTGAGTICVVIPSGVSQVIGCTLIAGGTALLVEAEWSDGAHRQLRVQLTEEQRQQLRDQGVQDGVKGEAVE